jgi:hypothetical protein
MIFNDDSMLDFRGTGFGDSVMDAIFGFDAGEVVITGRVPGALYVEDFSEGELGLQHIQPLEFVQDELSNLVTVDVLDIADASGLTEETLVEDGEGASDALTAANDDDAPSTLIALTRGKDAEPQVLTASDNEDVAGAGAGELNLIDPFDLAIPTIPQLSSLDAPVVTVAPQDLDADAPLMVGGRAYQSLSFLIIDTPFAVGDSQLTDYLRPSLNELLGLSAESGLGEDDGQAFVLPARSWLLH